MTTAVAAAASVPSSLTSTKALWTTADRTRSFALDMPASSLVVPGGGAFLLICLQDIQQRSLRGAVSAGKEDAHGGVVSDEEEEGVICVELRTYSSAHSGEQYRPAKRTLLVTLCRMKKRKGWSAMNVTGTNKARSVSTTAVAAAASVPSSLTSTKALWTTFDTTRSFAGDMPEYTHLNKLVGLLPVKPVGEAEGIRSVVLDELTQKFGEVCVDLLFIFLRLQALQNSQRRSSINTSLHQLLRARAAALAHTAATEQSKEEAAQKDGITFVPVPVPMGRALSGVNGKLRRPQRASSLGSVSNSLAGENNERECGLLGSQRHSRCGSRSRTPPPSQSPVTRARVNGTLEPSIEYSSCPRSISDPAQSQLDEDRPITPTLLGYEVMEERAKFTVFKVLVRKTSDESWVVFRRYTDFSRLNDKLKDMFPGFRLSLPPKRWFKDNYDTDFLEDRQLGLQAFLQNLVAHKDIANSQAVREFLCLDDPPGPFDSVLRDSGGKQLPSPEGAAGKKKEIASLKRRLDEREQAILLLEKHVNDECVSPGSLCGLSAQGSESSADADPDVESSAVEADQDVPDDSGCEVEPVRSSACWCGPSLSTSPPIIQVTQLYHQKLEQ
ncbi:hypothetical protein F7725_028686 [Dissostichus mawsoni]|uniref:Sorting nexin-16 n=1 Tax=Dissostichus mawsoni TaxID=36200 RepID=A0A7J5XIW1_DISMA|nr:hypothetical protein F7725_028686 [Dissostichus mawsoni]